MISWGGGTRGTGGNLPPSPSLYVKKGPESTKMRISSIKSACKHRRSLRSRRFLEEVAGGEN